MDVRSDHDRETDRSLAAMRILFLGDVVGESGVGRVVSRLNRLRRELGVDFCVVNGENSAQGNGISPKSFEQIIGAGADCVTTGNHAFRRPDSTELFEREELLLRPVNFHPSCPGRGYTVLCRGSKRLAVVNLMGRSFIDMPLANPFDAADECLAAAKKEGIRAVLFDFHAEATGEKRAMGFYLDSRASAVIGTHTHVQTADACVLPGGTAYITDAGMCGPDNSVLGVRPDAVIRKLRLGLPARFDFADDPATLEGCIIELDRDGRALSIEAIKV